MASFISAAVDEATRLPDIQFPEFTAKLITDTFNAIVAANLQQTDSFIQLLQATSKTLTEYINDTKDDVSGAEILEFLSTTLSPGAPAIANGNALSAPDATKLQNALTLPGGNAPQIAAGTLTQQQADSITDLVAQRLAANKYTLLKEMVKLGILRLVVVDGKIVSQLTFSTFASSFYTRNSASSNTKNFELTASAKSGRALSQWFSAQAATKYTSVSVRTTNETQRDVSGSSVNIFGRVEINFKTDYQPLSQ